MINGDLVKSLDLLITRSR